MNALFSLTLTTLLATPVFAGVVITTEEVKGAPDASPTKGEVLINGNLLLLKSEGQPDTIYRGDRGLIWMVMHNQKKYREINKRVFEQQAVAFQRQQAQMKAQMENMPEEQKLLMQNAMQGMLHATHPPQKVSVKKTDKTETIDDVPCTLWTAYAGGKKVADLWIASFDGSGISQSEINGIGMMSDYIKTLEILASRAPAGMQAVPNPLAYISQTDGVPKKIVRYNNGKFVSELRVTSMESKPIDANTFFVPRGYTR